MSHVNEVIEVECISGFQHSQVDVEEVDEDNEFQYFQEEDNEEEFEDNENGDTEDDYTEEDSEDVNSNEMI